MGLSPRGHHCPATFYERCKNGRRALTAGSLHRRIRERWKKNEAKRNPQINHPETVNSSLVVRGGARGRAANSHRKRDEGGRPSLCPSET